MVIGSAKQRKKLAVVYLANGGGGDESHDPTQDLEDPEESGLQMVLHREADQQLRKLVSQLPYDEQRLVTLVYFEGLSLQDAGSQLGISKSWASRLHSRILEKLGLQLRQRGLHD